MIWASVWLFRLWLILLLGPSLAFTSFVAFFERLFGLTTSTWRKRVDERLVGADGVVLFSLRFSFEDTYRHPDDGPGFSEAQIPKLWGTCRALAQQLGCPPPDAIHLSVEPGDTLAWTSHPSGGARRRHVALSLSDLRLLSHDEARAVIAHEIVHVGFDHTPKDHQRRQQDHLMGLVGGTLFFPLNVPVLLAHALHAAGVRRGAHDAEREADRKAAEVVGGNHVASALEKLLLSQHTLARLFIAIVTQAELGKRAPLRLAEATLQLYNSYDFPRLKLKSMRMEEKPGTAHPALLDRVESAQESAARAGIGPGRSFIDAYPELLAIEELLTKTYFPDTPTHTRSGASQLRRKALAARLQRR